MIYLAAGSTLAVAVAEPATLDEAGYTALTFLEVEEIETLGSIGKEFAINEFTALGNRRTRRRKGSYTSGQMSVTYAHDPDDLGQDMLNAMIDDDDIHSFRIELPTGETVYFTAQAASNPMSIGSANDFMRRTCELLVETDPLWIAAV